MHCILDCINHWPITAKHVSLMAGLSEGQTCVARKVTRPEPSRLFLWGFLKGKVYQSQPSNISELKESIKHVLADVTPELCRRVIANMRQRMKLCMQTGGGHFEHLL